MRGGTGGRYYVMIPPCAITLRFSTSGLQYKTTKAKSDSKHSSWIHFRQMKHFYPRTMSLIGYPVEWARWPCMFGVLSRQLFARLGPIDVFIFANIGTEGQLHTAGSNQTGISLSFFFYLARLCLLRHRKADSWLSKMILEITYCIFCHLLHHTRRLSGSEWTRVTLSRFLSPFDVLCFASLVQIEVTCRHGSRLLVYLSC